MAKLRRAVERRLAYAPRFLRHYRNRRQFGCAPAVAFRSARERMRQPPPMIVSPSCANRFAKSVSIRRSPRPCQSCASARWAWRGSFRTCGCCLGEGAIGSPGCSGVVGHRFPAKSRRDPRSQVNSPCLPAARLRHGHPAVWVAPAELTQPAPPSKPATPAARLVAQNRCARARLARRRSLPASQCSPVCSAGH